MYVTTNYIEEVDTPESKAFLDKFKAKFPDEPYVNQEAANSYIAIYLYKQMVERAKVDQARGHPQGARAGRCLLRRPVGQGLPRSEEPAHVAHDLSSPT